MHTLNINTVPKDKKIVRKVNYNFTHHSRTTIVVLVPQLRNHRIMVSIKRVGFFFLLKYTFILTRI